ncbi:MAG TPA: ribonuclease P protein component [Gemmatimonadales bacterium]
MACWERGHRRRAAHLDLAWQSNTKGHPRVGVIVPRHSQTAVARNRLRRRLREILRRGALAQLPAIDIVVRARRGAYAAPFAVLRAELTDALARVS